MTALVQKLRISELVPETTVGTLFENYITGKHISLKKTVIHFTQSSVTRPRGFTVTGCCLATSAAALSAAPPV